MIRTTAMPAAVLRRADQVTTEDVVLDADGQPWNVHAVRHGDVAVELFLRNVAGESAWRGISYDAWVRLATTESPARYRRRVVFRGLPWFVAAMAVAVWAHVMQALAFGGQVPAIICLVMVAAVRMATTPERDR